MENLRRMPLLLELHFHALAAIRAKLYQLLRMLLPCLAALVLLMKAEASDTETGF